MWAILLLLAVVFVSDERDQSYATSPEELVSYLLSAKRGDRDLLKIHAITEREQGDRQKAECHAEKDDLQGRNVRSGPFHEDEVAAPEDAQAEPGEECAPVKLQGSNTGP